MIRVLVVDDHQMFAESLARLLSSRDDIEVVGTAGTVADGVAVAAAESPDVILMDFELPDGDGPRAASEIKVLVPAARIIMLTGRADEESLIAAIDAGCAGFVRKGDSVDDLLAAIAAAHEGEAVAPPRGLAPLLRHLRPTSRGLGQDLTPREREILTLSAMGLVNKEAALRLGIRLNTVRNHVQNILTKLDAHSKLEAVATAVREGVIELPTQPG